MLEHLVDPRDAPLDRHLLGISLGHASGEDPDGRSPQHRGVVDPLPGIGQLLLATLPLGHTEVVADGRSRDVQTQPEGQFLHVHQKCFKDRKKQIR